MDRRGPGQEEDAKDVRAALEHTRPADSFGLERRLAMEMILSRAEAAPTAGPSVGRYRVLEKIGEGGMGAVYRALDPDLDRPVALKVMRVLTGEKHRRNLRDEARALARLAHPNVVSVHDLGMQDGQMYLTMEYVEGISLRSWIAEDVPRSWREIVSIFIDAGEGLAAAHAAGIIHRDFKPENVLLGTDGRVRVADFGLARKVITPDRAAKTVTATIAGTVAYMAPEIDVGQPASAASDQYSFCRTLGEALEVRSRLSVGQGEPPELVAIVERGLRADPRERHESMTHLLSRLSNTLVTRVADERREEVLSRVSSVLDELRATTNLAGSGTIPIRLSEVAGLGQPRYEDSLTSQPARAPRPRHLDTAHLVGALDRSGGALLLLGQPGSGKSTALLGLARDLTDRARRDTTEPIPILLNLASLGSHTGSIESWICMEVLAKYGISARQARARLRAEAWTLLLDGLDEAGDDHLEDVIRKLKVLRRLHPCPVVVAGRRDAYEAATERLDVRTALALEPLDAKQAVALCQTLGRPPPSLDDTAGSGLATPLVLTLAAVGGAELPADAGESFVRGRLYDDFVAHALEDVAPERRAPLREGLGWLARTMRARSLSELWVERLQADWLPGPAAFLARLLGALAVAAAVVGGMLLATLISGRELLVAWILGPGLLPVVLAFNRGLSVRPIGSLGWSWRRSLRRLPLAVGACVALGAIYGAFYQFWNNVMAAALAGFIISYPLGLTGSDEVVGLRPNRTIRRSMLNALIVGGSTTAMSGLILGVALLAIFMPGLPADSEFRQLAHPYWAAFWVSGAVVGIPAGLVAGGTAALLHGALRLVLAATTPLPLRLVAFLDEAVACGLLRRVGGVYVFPHRTMLEHLSRPAAAD